MPNCNQEKAGTRIVLHVVHSLEQGLKMVQVHTVGTYVIVILVGAFCDLVLIQPLADISAKTTDFSTLMPSVIILV